MNLFALKTLFPAGRVTVDHVSKTYRVMYPNRGRMPDFTGEFSVEVDPKLGPMPIIMVGGKANILDARAIVVDEDGMVVYTPRQVPLDDHTKNMRDWLVAHPKWGVG